MSNLINDELKEQKKLKDNLTRVQYEDKLENIATTEHDGFRPEALLLNESTEITLQRTFENELNDVARFAQIKVKQRSGKSDEDAHSIEYERGVNAINIVMNTKESHRNINKRKNSMEESSKLMTEANKQAIKIRNKYLKPDISIDIPGEEINAPVVSEKQQITDLKEKAKAMEKMYESVHSADRYFAESVSTNKHDEGRLKAHADVNYHKNLYTFYLRELRDVGDGASKVRTFLETRLKKMYDNYRKALSYAENNYGDFHTGAVKLSENENIDNTRESIKEEKKDRKTLNKEIDQFVADYQKSQQNKDEENKENKDKKDNENDELMPESTVGKWDDSDSLVSLLLAEEKKAKENNQKALKIINAQSKLFKENVILDGLNSKYVKKLKEVQDKFKEKYTNKDEATSYFKVSEEYKSYLKFSTDAFTKQLENELKAINADMELDKLVEQKSSIPTVVGEYNYNQRKLKAIRNNAKKLSTYTQNDFAMSYEKLEKRFQALEAEELESEAKLKKETIATYKKLNKIDEDTKVEFETALAALKSGKKVEKKDEKKEEEKKEDKKEEKNEGIEGNEGNKDKKEDKKNKENNKDNNNNKDNSNENK